MKRIRTVICRHWSVIVYLFFGGLTTLVNFLVYFPLYNLARCSAALSNIAAWVVAVIFAYLTNKPFVFQSHDWSRDTVVPELSKFVGLRILSGLLETMAIWIFVDLLTLNGNWIKLLVSVAVVILNYVFSKWLVFYKKEKA